MLQNPIAEFLNKSPQNFQRSDLVEYIRKNNVDFVQLRYPALDGRLKALKFPITSVARLEQILGDGERVDGSSLFKNILDPSKSDLYVFPIYETAFLNPFFKNTVDICCCYMNKAGEFDTITPSSILSRAQKKLSDSLGMELFALGELEFYLIQKPGASGFNAIPQRCYHETEPFLKGTHILHEMAAAVGQCIGRVKYAHPEVGFIPKIESENRELNGCTAEQYEIELLPAPVHQAAFDILIAKWIIRNVAYRHNAIATFAPKLEEGMAGTGMHIHVELRKDGHNVMQENGELSDEARCMIGGLCHYAPTLTAFANMTASSYLRLVPHQEAPTKIFWSENNRAALIREPLGWSAFQDMDCKVNPRQQTPYRRDESKQTVELRSPDGSASVFLLLAGMTLAACYGVENKQGLEIAKKHYVTGKIDLDSELYRNLPSLPQSCEEGADLLAKNRAMFESESVIPPVIIDYVIHRLKAEKDRDLYQHLKSMPAPERTKKFREIMHRDIDIG